MFIYLGFLGMGYFNVNGNQVLFDFLVVLMWIKENIVFFDGDLNRVILFGYGYGVVFVNFFLFV